MSLIRAHITDTTYTLSYIDEGEKLLTLTKDYGTTRLENFHLRDRSTYLLLDPLLHLLEKISLYERIPTQIILFTAKHGTWMKHILETYPYSQFYTGGKKMSVTLEKVTTKEYARHTEKTLNLKI